MEKFISIVMPVILVICANVTVIAEGDMQETLSIEVAPIEIVDETELESSALPENIDETEELEEVEELSSALSSSSNSNDTWNTAASLTSGRANFDTAIVDGVFYIVGGYDSSGYVNSIDKYNATTSSWETVTTIPYDTYGYTVVNTDAEIYVIGGYSNNIYLNMVQVFDTTTNTWSNITPMLERREEAASLFVDDKIYVFGGRNANGIVNNYEYYDMTNNTWNKVTFGYDESIIRIGAKGKFINGYICIYGGMNKNCEYKGVSLYSASDLTDVVLTCAAGKEHIAIAWGEDKGMIFAAPERSSSYTVYELTVGENDIYTNQINTMTLPYSKLYIETAIYDGYLYCMGGYSSSSYISATYKYSVYYGDYSLGDGNINNTVTADGNTITLNVDSGKEYVVMFNVSNMNTFSGYTFNIEYPENSFILVDGCALTRRNDTSLSSVNGTDIQLTKSNFKGVSFVCTEQVASGTTVSKTVNAVILRAQSSGQRTITYSMTR